MPPALPLVATDSETDARIFTIGFPRVDETGVTAHIVEKGIDTGRIIYQEKIPVEPDDSVFSLNIRQWLRGSQLIPQIFDLFRKGPVDTSKSGLRSGFKNGNFQGKSFGVKKSLTLINQDFEV